MTTIIIPVDDDADLQSTVSEHFGRAMYFAVFKIANSDQEYTLEIIPNRSEHTGGRGLPAQNMLALNPDFIISTGMGRRAISLFEQQGVGVLQCPRGTVEQVLTLYKNKGLTTLLDSCTQSKHGC